MASHFSLTCGAPAVLLPLASMMGLSMMMASVLTAEVTLPLTARSRRP